MTTIPIVGFRDKTKKKRLEIEVIEATMRTEDLPKEFDYLCPACFFQTNDFSVLCPKCGHKGLKESGKDRFRVVK